MKCINDEIIVHDSKKKNSKLNENYDVTLLYHKERFI